jgi:hypothetical protein
MLNTFTIFTIFLTKYFVRKQNKRLQFGEVTNGIWNGAYS